MCKDISSNDSGDFDEVSQMREEISKLKEQNETFKQMLTSYEKIYENVRKEIVEGQNILKAMETVQDLSRNELLQAKDEINNQSHVVELKNEFFSNISHELRTPLTLALAPLESLLEGEVGDLTPLQFSYIENIYKNTNKLVTLVDELLDFAKIDAGKLEPIFCEQDIVSFTGNVLEQFKPYANKHNIDFKIELPEKEINVFFDSDKIEKVISNLVFNALKYVEKEKIVTVEILENDKQVVFYVNNTGPKIPDEIKETVFDRFSRLENAKKKKVLGTGLGLSLSKEIIDLHTGEIKIESSEEKGTTVTFSLLKGTNHLSEEQIQLGWGNLERRRGQAPDRIQKGASPLYKFIDDFYDLDKNVINNLSVPTVFDKKIKMFNDKKKVIIADDNKEMLGFLKFVLSGQFNIYISQDGKEAFELARKIEPDLIVSDIMMPELDGYELCRKIKEDPNLNTVPIILLTAKANNVYAKIKGLEIGADDYIVKPFNVKELVARINALLRMKGLYTALENFENVIYSLANAVEAKDEYTNGHCQRLMDIAIAVSEKMGLNEKQIAIIRHGAILHDIGKIGIPEKVLNKNGKLTEDEFSIIKTHPIIGEKICKPLETIENFLPIIRNHHERIDGKGYPDGLKGDEIPIEVRIVSIADAFDAIYSDRPYRKGKSIADTLDFFNHNIGKGQWDDEILNYLFEIDFKELEKKW